MRGTALGADAALGPQRAAARPGGPHAGGSGGVEPPAVARHPVAAGPSHHAGAHHVDLRADRSGRQSVLRLAPGPGHGWVGVGVAVTHAPKRIAGTLAVAWGAGHAEPWVLLTDLPPARVDAAWDALRRWDEAGVRQSTSMGWDGRRGQVTDPDAVAWQERVVAPVTRWTVAVGTRIDDAAPQGVPPPPRTRGGLGGAGAAAPSLERHSAAGEPPAPAGDAAPALGAGARALLGPRVGAPGARAQKR